MDESDDNPNPNPEDPDIEDTSVTIRTMGVTTAPEGTRFNQVTVQPTQGAHLEHSIGTEDITADMILAIGMDVPGITNTVNITQELPTGQGDYINESTMTKLKIGKYQYEKNGLYSVEVDPNEPGSTDYVFPVAIDVQIPPSENTLTYEDLEREYTNGEWVEPGDVELENENGDVTANLDVSEAAIYPRNRFIKKENVVIQYDSTNYRYLAQAIYEYPVTRAEFQFDMDNSTLPNSRAVITGIKDGVSTTIIPMSDFFNTAVQTEVTMQPNTSLFWVKETINNNNYYWELRLVHFGAYNQSTAITINSSNDNIWYYKWTSYSNVLQLITNGGYWGSFSDNNNDDKTETYVRFPSSTITFDGLPQP